MTMVTSYNLLFEKVDNVFYQKLNYAIRSFESFSEILDWLKQGTHSLRSVFFVDEFLKKSHGEIMLYIIGNLKTFIFLTMNKNQIHVNWYSADGKTVVLYPHRYYKDKEGNVKTGIRFCTTMASIKEGKYKVWSLCKYFDKSDKPKEEKFAKDFPLNCLVGVEITHCNDDDDA